MEGRANFNLSETAPSAYVMKATQYPFLLTPSVRTCGKVWVYILGFSADQFSQNDDPDVGNKVYLVGASGSEYSCIVHLDGCTETQVQCYTPA